MTRKELKAIIPHGSAKLIAEKANVNPITVSNWFNEKTDNTEVEMAVLEFVADFLEKKKTAMDRIKTASAL